MLNKFDDFGGARHRNRDNLNPNEVYQPDDVKIAFLAFGNPTDHPEGQRRWSFNTLDPSVEIELEKDTQLEKESKSEEEGEEKVEKEEEEEASEESSQPSTMTAYLDPLVDTFSDEQAFRICVEALQLETFEGNAYMVYDHFVPLLDRTTRFTARAEKGMRELGYTSTEIYEHLFHYRIGTEYQSAYKHFQAQRKMGRGTTNWWDSPSFKKQIKERQALRNGGVYVEDEVKEEDIDREEAYLTPREEKIQDIAYEWGQRQFYKAKKEGTLNGRDLDTFLDDVWDEAVAQGLKQYNELKALGYLDLSAKQIEQKQMVLTKEASEAMGIVFTIPSNDDDEDDDDDDDDDE